MSRKAILLASAMLWLGGSAAEAEPAQGWFAAFDGGWSFVSGGETVYAVDRSAYPDLQERNVNLSGGVQGGFQLGYRLGAWDFGLRIGALVTGQNSDLTTNYGPNVLPEIGDERPPLSAGVPVPYEPDAYEYRAATATTDLTSVMLDFEAGYDLGIGGGASLRLFGGLRAGFIDSDTEMEFGYRVSGADGFDDPETLDVSRSSSFVGAGPRVGLQGEVGLGGGFGLFGGVAGSVLLGQLSVQTLSQAYGYSDSQERSAFQTVYQLEGEVGVSYSLTDAGVLGAVQVGYRAGRTWNAIDGSTGTTVIDEPLQELEFGDDSDDFTQHGPFVRLVFQF